MEKNVLEVCVTDELDTHILPYGKQCKKRSGMWYTPVSGIWQTVWMESVCEEYVTGLHIETGRHGEKCALFSQTNYPIYWD